MDLLRQIMLTIKILFDCHFVRSIAYITLFCLTMPLIQITSNNQILFKSHSSSDKNL